MVEWALGTHEKGSKELATRGRYAKWESAAYSAADSLRLPMGEAFLRFSNCKLSDVGKP